MDFAYYVIVGTLILFDLIIFIFRINKIGNILVSIRTSKGQFISGIVVGILLLILNGYTIYIKMIIKHLTIYSSDYILMSTSVIILFNSITSKTFIGPKGVSFSTIPFYIPLNKISSYTIEDSRLILNRINMDDYGVSINVSDSDKIIKVMNELKIEIDKDCKFIR